MKRVLLFFCNVLLLSQILIAGDFVQTIRGTVADKTTKTPLVGANIILLGSDPIIGVATDIDGNFRLENIKIGRVGIKVSFLGYKDVVMQNLVLNSAKELILNIEMEEMVISGKTIEIIGKLEKNETNNKMATVSTRLFTIEETERYAGSRGDPARMALNFAGVSGANDQRNDIIIRGNSPSGLLWKVEDVEIPNPNHFAAQGSTGGPVSMLNNNTLANSDFFTGAFPAEYGNALSGVFDLKMRNGNNEQHEFTAQSGFNGFELGAEGPISKKNRSSYMANYRYSTLGFLDIIGMDIGTSGVPYYQDLSFKFNFPIKNGIISWFGIAGRSHIAMMDSKKDTIDLFSGEGQDLYNGSDLAVSGITLTKFHNKNMYSKLILSGFFENANTKIDTLDLDKNPHLFFKEDASNYRASINYYFNIKINTKLSSRTGFDINRLAFNISDKYYSFEKKEFVKMIDNKNNLSTGNSLYKIYNQWVYKLNDRISFNPGFHILYFDLNEKISFEPRIGVNWHIAENQKVSIGYGNHSRLQPIQAYYFETRTWDGNYVKSNLNLESTKANHYVCGYDVSLTEYLRLKAEVYYQDLYNAPVQQRASPYSILNTGAGWGVDMRDSLVNTGTGKNYGIELTFEKFFHKGFYYLITTSIYDSKYKGSDGIERNTVFNSNYVINGLIGKEFKLNEKLSLVFDIKSTYAGGRRYTPIDEAASKAASSDAFSTVYIESETYAKQFSPYFKADFKVGLKKQGKVTQEWQFYVENITNHKNVLMQTYSKKKEKLETVYQLGIFPMVNYRIYF